MVHLPGTASANYLAHPECELWLLRWLLHGACHNTALLLSYNNNINDKTNKNNNAEDNNNNNP